MKKTLLFLSVLLSMAFCLIAEDLTDPYEILKRHFDAIGGLDKLKSIKSRKIQANVTIKADGQKQSGTMKSYSISDYEKKIYRSRTEMVFPQFTQITGQNDSIKWEYLAGQGRKETKLLNDEETKEEIREEKEEVPFSFLNPKSEAYEVTLEGSKKINKRPCYKVVVLSKKKETKVTRYIDKETFYVLKDSRETPTTETESIYSKYAEKKGLIVAYEVKRTIFPSMVRIKLNFTKFKFNAKLKDSLFDPPKKEEKKK